MACLLWLFVWSLIQRVPPFYIAAIDRSREMQAAWSDEFLKISAALAGDIDRPGHWQATFTTDQINGWLATDLADNFPDVLPRNTFDPRVQLAKQQATLGVRVGPPDAMTVYSITFDAYRVDDDTFALKLQPPHAGSLRLSIGRVQRELSAAAKKSNIPLEWRAIDGDLVALVRLDALTRDNRHSIRLEALEIRDGAVFFAGETVRLGRQ
jgi:hypothetical protein